MSGILKISTFQSEGIIHGFGTRNFSIEDLTAKFPNYKILSLRQIHSTRILACHSGEGDGIVCMERGTIITIKTADCLPVLIKNRENTMVAAIHAGWRGLCKGIVRETVSHLKTLGFPPSSLEIALGPSIGACCYEVGKEVFSCFRKNSLKYEKNGRNLDLFSTAKLHFLAEGITDKQIHGIPLCTKCHPELFFSHRGGERGRMISFIGLIKENTGGKI